jgi:hypothetical protein
MDNVSYGRVHDYVKRRKPEIWVEEGRGPPSVFTAHTWEPRLSRWWYAVSSLPRRWTASRGRAEKGLHAGSWVLACGPGARPGRGRGTVPQVFPGSLPGSGNLSRGTPRPRTSEPASGTCDSAEGCPLRCSRSMGRDSRLGCPGIVSVGAAGVSSSDIPAPWGRSEAACCAADILWLPVIGFRVPGGREASGHEGCRSAGQQRSATLNSGLPADTADRIHLGRGLPDAGDFGPPRRRRHNTGFQEFQAVEEAGEPLGAAQMV